MKIENIDYVLTAAKSATITEAANKLFLSQTTLSSAIRNIEQELDITIFERTQKGISLTAEGEAFVEIAEEMSRLNDGMRAISPRKKNAEMLRLIAHPVAVARYSVALADSVFAKTENASLSLLETPRGKVLETVASRKYKYGIGHVTADDAGEFEDTVKSYNLKCERLLTDIRYLYIGPGSPLINRERISVGDLKDTNFAITENSGVEEHYRSGYTNVIKRYTVCRNAHLSKEAVAGFGMCAFYYMTEGTPVSQDWFCRGTGIRRALVEGFPSERRHNYLIYQSEKLLSKNDRILLECVRAGMSPADK